MDSLTANLIIGLTGLAKGTTVNPANQSTVRSGTNMSVSLSSTGTGAGKANSVFGVGKTRTLAGGAGEELDFFSFTSILNETGASMTKCRIFYLLHLGSSVASSITVGNPSGNPFRPLAFGATATLDLLPGEFFIFGSPTTAGFTVSNTVKTWKVLNNDGVNSAAYEVGVIGEG